jgi:sugar/nucleoside kinase (ribokinase family)
MKYIIIGEPCVDVIHKADGGTIHSYGGILYSLISLSVLSQAGDELYPVMNLGADEYDNITDIIKKYSNIKLDGIYKVDHPTRKVNLYYSNYRSGKSARMESSSAPTYTIGYDGIEKFLAGADAMLINMISGVDISLDSVKKIKKNFSGKIHMDLHNIVMKTNPDGTREHVYVDNYAEWCTSVDTIQMNEYEIKTLMRDTKKEYKIAEEILIGKDSRTQGLVVTRGINGISGYTKKEKQFGGESYLDIDKQDVRGIENPHFKDSTGCGDVFASSFLSSFSKSGDFIKSVYYANRMASYKTSFEGIAGLENLK